MNYIGLDVLGVSYNEDFGPLSPAQLANIDRALTPEEQKAVDDWQIKQANAMQKKEESRAFVNPSTGKMTFVTTNYEEGAGLPSYKPNKPAKPADVATTATGEDYLVLGGALAGTLMGMLIPRSHAMIGGVIGLGVGAGIGYGTMRLKDRLA